MICSLAQLECKAWREENGQLPSSQFNMHLFLFLLIDCFLVVAFFVVVVLLLFFV